MSTLERAIALAAMAHAGGTNKAGEPYILHPLRVMLHVTGLETQMAAVLHDVVEDTALTLVDLRHEGFPDAVIEAVAALSHGEDEDYFDAVARAGRNDMARAIKRADLEDNMEMTARGLDDEASRARMEKYRRAYGMLTE